MNVGDTALHCASAIGRRQMLRYRERRRGKAKGECAAHKSEFKALVQWCLVSECLPCRDPTTLALVMDGASSLSKLGSRMNRVFYKSLEATILVKYYRS